MMTNNETMISERDAMLAGLRAFVRQRPGLDFRNYWSGDHWNALSDARANYRADLNPIMRAKRDAETMLRYLGWRESISAEQIKEAARSSFGGRLSWNGQEWEYCTGQYWPTEYRKAACVVLASVIWRAMRESVTTQEMEACPDCSGLPGVKNVASLIRKRAAREFGRGVASRWFA